MLLFESLPLSAVNVTVHVLGFMMKFALIISSEILDRMIKSFSFFYELTESPKLVS